MCPEFASLKKVKVINNSQSSISASLTKLKSPPPRLVLISHVPKIYFQDGPQIQLRRPQSRIEVQVRAFVLILLLSRNLPIHCFYCHIGSLLENKLISFAWGKMMKTNEFLDSASFSVRLCALNSWWAFFSVKWNLYYAFWQMVSQAVLREALLSLPTSNAVRERPEPSENLCKMERNVPWAVC